MHTTGGYLDQKTRSPVSMGAAIAINGAIIGALLLSAPEIIPEGIKYIPLIDPIEKAPDPVPVPPEPPKQQTENPKPRDDRITLTKQVSPQERGGFTATEIFPPSGGTGTGEGIGTIPSDPPMPPIFVGPEIERKYLKDFQPPYPPGMQRLGEEGVVVVRVLVGPDGRVKRVERVEVTDNAFFLATEAQALKKWRFRPATRDGVPVEGWRTMTVRFELKD